MYLSKCICKNDSSLSQLVRFTLSLRAVDTNVFVKMYLSKSISQNVFDSSLFQLVRFTLSLRAVDTGSRATLLPIGLSEGKTPLDRNQRKMQISLKIVKYI